MADGEAAAPVAVKVGGASAVDPGGALADVAAVVGDGTDVVVVHGGSTAVDDALERMGIEPEYVETPSGVVGRFTDAETMDVFTMAMAGRVNTDLVTGLQNEGCAAVGLSGVDGGLFTGPRKSAVRVLEEGTEKIRRGDHSGRIESVEDDLLETLFSEGYTPVVSPPMLAEDVADRRSAEGETASRRWMAVNTDADRASAAVAAALDGTLLSLTDVAGVYRDPDDPETVIDRVETPAGYEELTDAAEGFMDRKVMAATEALEGGASEVVIADANAESPVRSALSGGGTHILPTAIE
jgi:acetylglutamate/LysW-gamma-L-alpha-aminoadipate kinase